MRKLQNAVELAIILNREGSLYFDRFVLKQKDDKSTALPDNEEEFLELDDLMSLHIQRALTKTSGKIHGPNGAARLLGINPSTLRSRIKKLGIH